MLVHNILATEKKESVKKAKRKNAAGGFSVFMDGDDNENVTATSKTSHVLSINSLLSLQEFKSENDIIKENLTEADNALNDIENYTNNIIKGKDTKYNKLSLKLSSRTKSANKALEDILDSIELRAAVEAAKMENK